MKTMFIFLLPIVLTLQHCHDDAPKPLTELEKLPPATQSGKRTFGCLMDGKAWVIEGITDVSAYYQTGTLFIAAGLATQLIDQTIAISLEDNNLSEKEYILSDYPQAFGRLTDKNINCQYLTSSTLQGKFLITHLDNINFIISGSFEFEAYSTDCTKTIKITDGRFDIHYAA